MSDDSKVSTETHPLNLPQLPYRAALEDHILFSELSLCYKIWMILPWFLAGFFAIGLILSLTIFNTKSCSNCLESVDFTSIPFNRPYIPEPFNLNIKCLESDQCNYSPSLQLSCEGFRGTCNCEKRLQGIRIDRQRDLWHVRFNYTTNICLVGKFGPCGFRNGFDIGCYGHGITCINGTCLDSLRPFAYLEDPCQENENCVEGLICSAQHKCIQFYSQGEGVDCASGNECQSRNCIQQQDSGYGFGKCARL